MTPYASVLAALLALPVATVDRNDELKPAQYAALAHEISRLKPPRGVGPKDWRALVIAVGAAETHFALHVMDGRCRLFECDRGKARSAWQLHENLFTRPVWDQLQGLEHLPVQVQTADSMMKRMYYQCERSNPEGFWVNQVILGFAGKGCKVDTIAPWRGLELRRAYWAKALIAMN